MPSRTASVRLSPAPSRSSTSTTLTECSLCQNRCAEALGQALVERLLADVAERRVPEVVAEPDRLGQVLVQPQRTSDGARHLGDLERVRQPSAVVVADRQHEHLRLVLAAAGTPCCGRSGRGRAGTGSAARSRARDARLGAG